MFSPYLPKKNGEFARIGVAGVRAMVLLLMP
jgi:hypothetical protein